MAILVRRPVLTQAQRVALKQRMFQDIEAEIYHCMSPDASQQVPEDLERGGVFDTWITEVEAALAQRQAGSPLEESAPQPPSAIEIDRMAGD